MSFSSWVENVSIFASAILATLYWITVIVALVKMTWKVFVYFPWWIFIITSIYWTLLACRSRWAGIFGAISKVYAPFVILIYWVAIYPNHNPWADATDSYLVVMAHIVSPAIIIYETFRLKNTHLLAFKQRNADFPVIHSFGINTVVYVTYVGVYLLVLPSMSDPIYTTIGFTFNEGRDALVALQGLIVVLFVNCMIALFTWVCRNREIAMTAENFRKASGTPASSYVMDVQRV